MKRFKSTDSTVVIGFMLWHPQVDRANNTAPTAFNVFMPTSSRQKAFWAL